jgi:hypothetical protein
MARHKRLEEIRNIRNWTVGHPTKIDRYQTLSHHAIQRPQLGRGGFSLYSAFDDGREQYTYVPLPQLARLQRRVVSNVMRDILAQLNAQQREKKKASAPKRAVKVSVGTHKRRADAPVPQDRKYGSIQRQPPQLATGQRHSGNGRRKKNRKRQSVLPAMLMPLPGERFERQRPAV